MDISEIKMQTFINSLPISAVVLDENGIIEAVNDSWEEFARKNSLPPADCGPGINYLKTAEEAEGEDEEIAEKAAEGIKAVLAGEREEFTLEYPCHSPDKKRWFEMVAKPLGEGVLILHENVTDFERSKRQLNEKVKEINCLYETARLLADVMDPLQENLQKAASIIKSGWRYPDSTSVKISYNEIEVYSDNFERARHSMSRKISLAGDREGRITVYCSEESEDGGSPFLPGEVKLIDSLAELLRSLIKINENQKKLEYLANYDRLTGLYNHNHFIEEMERFNHSEKLPISIILLDINGLQLFNESLGYNAGDRILEEVAGKLSHAARKKDVVARWGEDEFAVLMPLTSREDAEIVKDRVENSCKNIVEQGMKISISSGLSTKYKPEKDLHDVLNEALEKLNQNKLTKSESSKSKMVQSLLNALREKSEETEVHADRLEILAQKLGEKIGLNDSELNSLSLLARLHDIGKIMISEEILKKPGKLNDEEWEDIKAHPEVGSNIVAATEEFSHIADEIRHHHEHWNGRGYPDGLEGEEIPLLSRIISIVDAYDVITNERAYKEASSREEAISELKRCAGEQFDPYLVEKFVELLRESSFAQNLQERYYSHLRDL